MVTYLKICKILNYYIISRNISIFLLFLPNSYFSVKKKKNLKIILIIFFLCNIAWLLNRTKKMFKTIKINKCLIYTFFIHFIVSENISVSQLHVCVLFVLHERCCCILQFLVKYKWIFFISYLLWRMPFFCPLASFCTFLILQ